MADSIFDPPVNGIVLNGDDGNNILTGTNLNDQIFSFGGNDRLSGLNGLDLLEGGIGNDLLFGGNDDDWLFGGVGNDALSGDSGHDELIGGDGTDILRGGSGDDLLNGGMGDDILFLGSGADTVVLAPGNGTDTVLDYKDGTDKIQLDGDLTFNDLEISSLGRRNTLIRIDKPGDPNDNERLAIFIGVRSDKFDETDFVNTAPDAVDDAFTTDEDTAVNGNLFADNGSGVDVDPDGDTFTITGNTDPTNGAVVVNADGSFTYTPNANFNGSDSFTYTIDDGNGGTDTATVNLTINPVNDAPDAVDDAFTTDEDTAVNGNLFADNGSGVDVDPDGDTFTITGNTDPTNGAVVVNADGSFTYTPNANFNGSDSFTYTIDDGNGGTDTATVNLTINPVNDAPVNTVPGAQTTDSATPINFGANIQISDVDVGTGTVQANLSVGFGTLTATTGVGATITNNGSAAVTVTGTLVQVNAALNGLVYDPAGTTGNATITIVTNDQGNTGSGGALTDTDTIAVTVNASNVDPVAQDQSYSTFGNTVLEVAGADIPGDEVTSVTNATSLLTGATDANGDTLTVQAETLTTTEGGSVTINANGSFFYTPEAGDANVADTFTFTVLDGNGGSSIATATINVSSDRIWYVDNDAAVGGDGTSGNPFNSLVPINTGGSSDSLDEAGDTIYVLDGTYTGGITLENNQSLLGQAVDLVVDGTTLISGSNASRPSLSSPNANAITLTSGNTVRGLDITGATTQNGIVGSNVGDTLIDNVTFTDLAFEAVQLINTTSNATITLQNNTVNSPNSNTGVELEVINDGGATNVTVDVINNTLSNVSNGAILVDGNGNGTVNTTISGNNITVDNAGSFTIEVDQAGNGTINALIDNNTILGQLNNTDAIFVVANNGNGTLNATITNNSNDTAPTVLGAGLFGRVQNNNTLNLNISDNSFTGLDEEIFLTTVVIAGANPTLNITQTSEANLSTVNNGARVVTMGANFDQSVPPTP